MSLKSLYCSAAITLLALVWSVPGHAGLIQVSSDFASGTDGWTKAGDRGSVQRWSATGGHPDGFLYNQDAADGTTDFFVAPGKYLGNLSDFNQGSLSFDIRLSQRSNPSSAVSLVYLTTSAGVLQSKQTVGNTIGGMATGQWYNLSFVLDPANWLLAGKMPTAAQFVAALSSVTQLRLLADWRSGGETVSLDNVLLTGERQDQIAVSAPATLGLLGLMLLALVGYRRRA